MGKGDKKTKRGKIAKGTFGVSRPRPSASSGNQDTGKTKKEKKSGGKKSSKAGEGKK